MFSRTFDPDNRLVAGELERRWNAALEKVRALEEKLAQAPSGSAATLPTLDDLGDLAADLARAWDAPAADPRLKKRILRAVIEEIIVEVDPDRPEVACAIHWKGGVHTELRVPRRRRGQSGSHTSPDVIDAVQHLACVCDDKLIASYLNRNGLVTGRGNRWNRMAVTSLRTHRQIAVYSPETQQAEWLDEPHDRGGPPGGRL